jgi:hypothetical protein
MRLALYCIPYSLLVYGVIAGLINAIPTLFI